VRVTETGADLAIALAVASAHDDVAFDPFTVALGEVGLGGELRQVAHTPRRLAEAARLGFTRAIVPASCPDAPGVDLVRVHDLREAVLAISAPAVPRPEPEIVERVFTIPPLLARLRSAADAVARPGPTAGFLGTLVASSRPTDAPRAPRSGERPPPAAMTGTTGRPRPEGEDDGTLTAFGSDARGLAPRRSRTAAP
jgi:hypothetical protein